jgi:hypothetical protein
MPRFPAGRNGSAIPVKLPIESLFDPITLAGRLWRAHHERCPHCDPAIPGCPLGETQYAVYVGAWEQEQRAALARQGRSRR